MKYLVVLFAILLAACDGGGGSSSGGGGGPDASLGHQDLMSSGLHTYKMVISTPDPDFHFAPVILGSGTNQNSPGPQWVYLGSPVSYEITDTQADFQISGIGDVEGNNAFYVDVVLYKDGVAFESWQIAVGVYEESGWK